MTSYGQRAQSAARVSAKQQPSSRRGGAVARRTSDAVAQSRNRPSRAINFLPLCFYSVTLPLGQLSLELEGSRSTMKFIIDGIIEENTGHISVPGDLDSRTRRLRVRSRSGGRASPAGHARPQARVRPWRRPRVGPRARARGTCCVLHEKCAKCCSQSEQIPEMLYFCQDHSFEEFDL